MRSKPPAPSPPIANPFATRFTSPHRMKYLGASKGGPSKGVASKEVVPLVDRWERGQRLGLIWGPHGSGKSVLMRRLIAELRHRDYDVRWVKCQSVARFAWPRLQAITGRSFESNRGEYRLGRARCNHRDAARSQRRTVMLVDGYEQLNWVARWSIRRWVKERRARDVRGLWVTAHRQLTGFPVVEEVRPDAALFAELTRRLQRVQPSAAGADAEVIGERDAYAAFHHHRGNMREAFFELYDLWGKRTGRSSGRVEHADHR